MNNNSIYNPSFLIIFIWIYTLIIILFVLYFYYKIFYKNNYFYYGEFVTINIKFNDDDNEQNDNNNNDMVPLIKQNIQNKYYNSLQNVQVMMIKLNKNYYLQILY